MDLVTSAVIMPATDEGARSADGDDHINLGCRFSVPKFQYLGMFETHSKVSTKERQALPLCWQRIKSATHH